MITMTIGVDLHKRESQLCLLGRSRGFVRPSCDLDATRSIN